VAQLWPEAALQLSAYEVLELLSGRYGFGPVQEAFREDAHTKSPVADLPDGNWLKKTRMVGINVRTVGSFFNVVKYALTLPAFHNCIHMLPIWEPGVVGSLYGIASWQINPEFFSQELYVIFPHLNTVEKQLRACMNALHLMGFTVGMDVIPHTDRFSEPVLAYPRYFEWVCQKNGQILDHSELLWQKVERTVYDFLVREGTADGTPLPEFSELFGDSLQQLPEEKRLALLFGRPADYGGRQKRRIALMRHVLVDGYETLPMTMAPPYRALHINKKVYTTDETGHIWYQYDFDDPQPMSRVFGPLTRYRLYHSKHNNEQWELDFDRPIQEVWEYVAQSYATCQQNFGFDFMRGDMTHVQMRPEGVPAQLPPYYDLLGSVKKSIASQGVPSFAFFAESFVGAPDYMGYGDEVAHLEAIGAEVTLGDLQSTRVGSGLFTTRLRQYLDIAATRKVKPSFTVITADKDDPRFDEFYHSGNLVRYFIALFMTELPSYVAAGFELRNLHLERGPNEEYSKLYVFQIHDEQEIDKVTRGPYRWGQNQEQFEKITELRQWAEKILPACEGAELRWLNYPDPTLSVRYCAWQLADYVFVCNLNGHEEVRHVHIPERVGGRELLATYSSEGLAEETIRGNGLFFTLSPLQPGECRIYTITT
jgi:hypothetical protein